MKTGWAYRKGKMLMVLLCLLLAAAGCRSTEPPATAVSPVMESFAFSFDSKAEDAGTESDITVVTSTQTEPEPEKAVDPEAYLEAVQLMADDNYTDAAPLLEAMGTYRNADKLAAICRGITEQNYDAAVEAMMWVEALGTFTAEDPVVYKSWDLRNVFWHMFEEHRYDENVEGLDSLCSAVRCQSLLYYDSIEMQDGEPAPVYSPSKEELLLFQNVTLSDWMDEGLLEACKGNNTGKILIVEKGRGSGSSFKVNSSAMLYALPPERIPRNLAEVEYVLIVDDDYDQKGVYSNGAIAMQYKITITLRRYPEGSVIYDSGLLIGDEPKKTVTVFGPTAAINGGLPDMTEALDTVTELMGLNYDK